MKNTALVGLAGFMIGTASLQAYSRGLGAPVDDLGLDLQGYLTIAGGTVFYPATVAAIMWGLPQLGDLSAGHSPFQGASREYVTVLQSSRGVALNVFSLFVPPIPLAWLTFGDQGGLWFLAAVVVCTWLAAIVPMVVLADEEGELRVLWDYFIVVILIGLSVVALVASVITFYWWGDAVQDGRYEGYRGPLSLEVVVPATRGDVTSGVANGCVDRVGQNLFVADGGAIAITAWDSFVITPCERTDLESLTSSRSD